LSDEGRRTRPREPRTSPLSGGTRCRLQDAACSPVVSDEFASRGADPASGAGRLVAGSDETPELANSLALRLPASRRWGALGPLVDMVPWIPTGTAGFFFRRDIAILSSFRMAGESFMVEKDLIKANSSCLSMMLRQELYYATKDTGLPMRSVTVCAGTTRPVRKSLLARCP